MQCSDLHIFIPSSKTDQFKCGYLFTLKPTVRSVCTVRAYAAYASVWDRLGSHNKPFFMFEDGSFLTRVDLSHALRNWLKNLPNGHRYSSHSFRNGAATAAAFHKPSKIKRAGRWRSDCYASYIRAAIPDEEIPLYWLYRIMMGYLFWGLLLVGGGMGYLPVWSRTFEPVGMVSHKSPPQDISQKSNKNLSAFPTETPFEIKLIFRCWMRFAYQCCRSDMLEEPCRM